MLFGQERIDLESIVIAFAHLFVSFHTNLPSIILEEHQIALIEGTKLVHIQQHRLILN